MTNTVDNNPPMTTPTEAAYTSGLRITSRDPAKPILPTDMEQVATVQTALTAERDRPQGIIARVIAALRNLDQ